MSGGEMRRMILAGTLAAVTLTAQLPEGEWDTDLSRTAIDLSELHVSTPKDGIPAIDHPTFTTVTAAASWIGSDEPVLAYESSGIARAYPVQILLFHELVNDVVRGRPILVSFCPLCNSGVIFDRRVGQETYSFGVAGLLRHNDMIMYDRETDSLWQQITGEAIVGTLTGKRLPVITGRTVPFKDFAESFPKGEVLARPAGSSAPYGTSLYSGYEFGRQSRTPGALAVAPGIAPLDRVLLLVRDEDQVAYSFEALQAQGVWENKIAGDRVVIFFDSDLQSAMDRKQITESRAVGAAAAYFPYLDGKLLRFKRKRGEIIDKETKSTWNVLGQAIAGPLAGRRLEPLPSATMFAFAAATFYPEARFVGLPRPLADDPAIPPRGRTNNPFDY